MCIREPIRGLYDHGSLTDSHSVQQNRRSSQTICSSTKHADAGTMYPTTAGPILRTVRIGPIAFSPAARLSVVEHPNPAQNPGRGSFITRIEDPRAQFMHSQRSSWKTARDCDVACNALRLAMNSASDQYTFHVHFLGVKVGNASNITELSAIQQARAMCSRRRKDGLHHDGWITPAARCGLNSRALNEVTDHRQYYPSIMSNPQHPILLLSRFSRASLIHASDQLISMWATIYRQSALRNSQ